MENQVKTIKMVVDIKGTLSGREVHIMYNHLPGQLPETLTGSTTVDEGKMSRTLVSVRFSTCCGTTFTRNGALTVQEISPVIDEIEAELKSQFEALSAQGSGE
jgi:hypothetical protein